MALGFDPKRKGLFGRPVGMPQATPPIAGNDPMMQDPAPGLGMRGQPEPQGKPGFLGKGGVGRAIAGTIGDYLMQREGMAPVYSPAMQQQAAMVAQSAADQRKRAMDLADYGAKKQIDQQYAQPEGPKTYEDNAGNRWAYDPATGQTIGDKPIWIDPTERVIYQDGMQIRVPNPYKGGMQGAQPQVLGSSLPEGWTIEGGGTGNGVGGFR